MRFCPRDTDVSGACGVSFAGREIKPTGPAFCNDINRYKSLSVSDKQCGAAWRTEYDAASGWVDREMGVMSIDNVHECERYIIHQIWRAFLPEKTAASISS